MKENLEESLSGKCVNKLYAFEAAKEQDWKKMFEYEQLGCYSCEGFDSDCEYHK